MMAATTTTVDHVLHLIDPHTVCQGFEGNKTASRISHVVDKKIHKKANVKKHAASLQSTLDEYLEHSHLSCT